MAIILRKFQTFPTLQPDGSMLGVPYATIAVVNGQQSSQINILASEVDGLSEGDTLAFLNHETADWDSLKPRLLECVKWNAEREQVQWIEDPVEIIRQALERPLEMVKAEPHGLDVPVAHDEMIMAKAE